MTPDNSDDKYCVYVAGKPFAYGSWSKEECEKICKDLNDHLVAVRAGEYDHETWENK